MKRREFLKAAGAAGAIALTGGANVLARAARSAVPSPGSSGIDHIVVVCMENRSYDHYLGWVPGSNGTQAGLAYPDDDGVMHPTRRWTDWTGCGYGDPDHGYEGGRLQLNGGAADGFRRGENDDYALSYYIADDLEATAAIAAGYTVADNYFCSFLGPTFPNRLYTHSAGTDRITNTFDTCPLPTIWDRLEVAGVPAGYYFSDLPVLGLYGERHIPISNHIEAFFAQAASGTLPNYAYLDPYFLGEIEGASNDDHPHADIRRGQAFVSEIINVLQASPLWSKTVLVVTYDEWGGFFDHVPPPVLPDDFVPTPTEEHNTAGFRVPTYIVSPFAPRGGVAHDLYDHSSILKMVEWRFGLAPLSARDAAANNLAGALDFSAPNLVPAAVPLVIDPGPHLCVDGHQLPSTQEMQGEMPHVHGMRNDDPFWRRFAESALLSRSWRHIA